MTERNGDEAGKASGRLARRLGLADAVGIGLGAMIGAGIFAVVGPAVGLAGTGALLGLVIAGGVAWCNATSSAQLAAVHPESGGTYVHGRERLGPFWGYLAGWGFVVGKLASCAAMALTFATYAAPEHARALAVAAVLLLTAVNYFGIKKTAALTHAIVVVVLISLGVVLAGVFFGGQADVSRLSLDFTAGPYPVLQAAGLWFFAFAGYARLATLGEEVTDPARTIPRAIPLALGITLLLYITVAVAALLALDPEALGAAPAPLVAAVEAGRLAALSPAVQVGAAVASLGVLLSLIVGVSRTLFAMSARRDLPGFLDAVHRRYRVPHRAELLVGALVAILVAVADLRFAIGFSAFTVLVYYAITNAAALRLGPAERRWPRWVPVVGLVACLVLAFSLPLDSALAGAGVLLAGVAVYLLRRGIASRP